VQGQHKRYLLHYYIMLYHDGCPQAQICLKSFHVTVEAVDYRTDSWPPSAFSWLDQVQPPQRFPHQHFLITINGPVLIYCQQVSLLDALRCLSLMTAHLGLPAFTKPLRVPVHAHAHTHTLSALLMPHVVGGMPVH